MLDLYYMICTLFIAVIHYIVCSRCVNCQGICLVYDVANPNSFNNLKSKWIRQVKDVSKVVIFSGPSFIIIIAKAVCSSFLISLLQTSV